MSNCGGNVQGAAGDDVGCDGCCVVIFGLWLPLVLNSVSFWRLNSATWRTSLSFSSRNAAIVASACATHCFLASRERWALSRFSRERGVSSIFFLLSMAALSRMSSES
eukprot:JP446649.1.p3 GENE.JP446649.1~~JP446649.1.p3  ORF type:complete len:108 (+),score=7.47 JP446649.1:428-751(+)